MITKVSLFWEIIMANIVITGYLHDFVELPNGLLKYGILSSLLYLSARYGVCHKVGTPVNEFTIDKDPRAQRGDIAAQGHIIHNWMP